MVPADDHGEGTRDRKDPGLMGRYSSSGSYSHRIQRIGRDFYRLHWTVDRYYQGSRLRYPRGCSRDTDEAGATRFAKKWHLEYDFDTAEQRK